MKLIRRPALERHVPPRLWLALGKCMQDPDRRVRGVMMTSLQHMVRKHHFVHNKYVLGKLENETALMKPNKTLLHLAIQRMRFVHRSVQSTAVLSEEDEEKGKGARASKNLHIVPEYLIPYVVHLWNCLSPDMMIAPCQCCCRG